MTTAFDEEEFVHCSLHEDATATAIAPPEVAAPSEAGNVDGAAIPVGTGATEPPGGAPANLFVNAALEFSAQQGVGTNVADVESTSQNVKESEVQDAGCSGVEPARMDVLCGRGAAVNAHEGNKRFRALCFSRKPEVRQGLPVRAGWCTLAIRKRQSTPAPAHNSFVMAILCRVVLSLKLVTTPSRGASPLKLSSTL
jgi:hypothetical protein